MMKNLMIIFVLAFCFSCKTNQTIGQQNINKKAESYNNQAQEYLFERNYEAAINALENAIKIEPEYLRAHFNLAIIYQNQYKNYQKAIAIYEQIESFDATNPSVSFNKGMSYFNLQELDEAKKTMIIYLNQSTNNQKGIRQANQVLKNIEFSKKALQKPLDIEYKNLGAPINTPKNEYFPSLTSDNEMIYFTVKDNKSNYAAEDIFFSKFENGSWQAVQKINSSINTNANEGAHCISSGGNYLLFASDNYKYGNEGRFDIYLAKKTGDKFRNPINLGKNINSRYWDSQPVLSADSKQLFFVSKRKDGLGGSDIYVSTLNSEGKFGPAENLGNTINTSFDEQRPYLHPDGKTLYFASGGHAGMGGADLYKSTLQEDGSWSKPENLGYPINTTGDEFGIFVSAMGNTAYISSDRTGGFGGQDIYSFNLPTSLQPELVTYIKGNVTAKETNEALKANIKIYNLKTGTLYKSLSSDEINGSFLTTIVSNKNYAFETLAKGYLPFSENVSIQKLKNNEAFVFNIELEKIDVGKEFTLNNIFFETNAFTLLDISKIELNYLVDFLKNNENTKIEIGGHTDDVGSDESNLNLSENRAKSVYNFLLEKGISTSRITYKGYGETKPLFENNSDENRAKNRRTSFKVL